MKARRPHKACGHGCTRPSAHLRGWWPLGRATGGPAKRWGSSDREVGRSGQVLEVFSKTFYCGIILDSQEVMEVVQRVPGDPLPSFHQRRHLVEPRCVWKPGK